MTPHPDIPPELGEYVSHTSSIARFTAGFLRATSQVAPLQSPIGPRDAWGLYGLAAPDGDPEAFSTYLVGTDRFELIMAELATAAGAVGLAPDPATPQPLVPPPGWVRPRDAAKLCALSEKDFRAKAKLHHGRLREAGLSRQRGGSAVAKSVGSKGRTHIDYDATRVREIVEILAGPRPATPPSSGRRRAPEVPGGGAPSDGRISWDQERRAARERQAAPAIGSGRIK